MNLHSFIYENEIRPIAQFTKTTSRVSKLFQLKNLFELLALSSKTIAGVRNRNVESRKQFKKNTFWVLKH